MTSKKSSPPTVQTWASRPMETTYTVIIGGEGKIVNAWIIFL